MGVIVCWLHYSKCVIKALKVVQELFKFAKQSCYMQEQFNSCIYGCLSKLFRSILVSFTLHLTIPYKIIDTLLNSFNYELFNKSFQLFSLA